MDFIFLIAFLFVGGGWLVGKIFGNSLFPKNDTDNYEPSNDGNIIIQNNYYNTTNNLNVTEEKFNQLTDKK